MIIPGIGALIATREAAYVDEEMRCIVPPRRFVSFNSSIVNNDGLLASSIRRRERLSYEEALHILDSYVEAIRSALETEGEVSLGQIGTLQVGAEKTLNFTPAYTAAEATDRLGFYSVPMGKTAAEIKTARPATDSERHFDRARNYYIAINKTLAKAVAVVAIVFMTAVTILIPGANEPRMMDHASVMPVAVKATAEVKNEATAPEVAEQITELQSTPTPEANVEDNGDALLVVAAFANASEAEDFISQHAASDFALSSVKGKRYIYVIAGHSANSEDLKAITSIPGFYKEFPQAWIRR